MRMNCSWKDVYAIYVYYAYPYGAPTSNTIEYLCTVVFHLTSYIYYIHYIHVLNITYK